MKNNFALRLFYILFIIGGVQLSYATSMTKLSFQFIYSDSNIKSVTFESNGSYENADQEEDRKNNGKFEVSTDSQSSSYTVTVNTQLWDQGSAHVADRFNSNSGYSPSTNYDYSHLLEIGGPETHAAFLDFWFSGKLYINGNLIDDNFTFAHNNKNNSIAALSWWISSTNGNRYTSNNVTEFTVRDVNGTYYCLRQNSTNYQVNVTSNSCSGTDFSNAVDNQLLFNYGGAQGTGGVYFTYNSNHDDLHDNTEYLENVYYDPQDYWSKYYVHVVSKLSPDSGIAASFNTKLGDSTLKMMKLDQSTIVQALPTTLDYWIEGSLYANGQLIASDLTLALDSDGETWWVGSKDASILKNTLLKIGNFCLQSASKNQINVLDLTYCNSK